MTGRPEKDSESQRLKQPCFRLNNLQMGPWVATLCVSIKELFLSMLALGIQLGRRLFLSHLNAPEHDKKPTSTYA